LIESDFAQESLSLEHFLRRTGLHFGGKCSRRPVRIPRVASSHHVIGLAAAFWLAFANAALAQVGLSASLASDYRLRGYSLTHSRPALSVNLAYESRIGVYAGGSAVVADTARSGAEALGYLAYAGYAVRTGRGTSWDVGVSRTRLDNYYFGNKIPIHYTEVYAGVTAHNVSLHVQYSPDYIQPRVESLYLDLSAVGRPAPGWRVSGHVGVLTLVSGPIRPERGRTRYDLQLGVAREFERCDVSLAWTLRGPDEAEPGGARPKRSALVAGLSYFF
jgi:uncharacterized protein (TIGR02001 family)